MSREHELHGRNVDVSAFSIVVDERRGPHEIVLISAGRQHSERVVPPAGEQHAYTRTWRDHTIEIAVSATGRSVRVSIDGKEIEL